MSPHTESQLHDPPHGRATIEQVLALAMIVAISGISLGGALWFSRTPGELTIDPAAANLGNVPPSTKHHLMFQVRNHSGRTVVIDSVTASCDCTEPTIQVVRLAAGTRTVLTAGWTMPAVLGPASAGIKLTYRQEGIDSPMVQWIDLRAKVVSK